MIKWYEERGWIIVSIIYLEHAPIEKLNLFSLQISKNYNLKIEIGSKRLYIAALHTKRATAIPFFFLKIKYSSLPPFFPIFLKKE